MSSARGLANHHLYLARILLGAWQRDIRAEDIPARTLVQAYAPGCHRHLRLAYGWFLLAILAPDELPPEPPAAVAALPERPAGQVLPAEIKEFALLERDGWLGEMLAWQAGVPARPAPKRSPDNLARAGSEGGGEHADFSAWSERLEALFLRMSDSLDEC